MLNYVTKLILNSESIRACVYSTGNTSFDVFNDLLAVDSFVEKIRKLKIISEKEYNEYTKAKSGKKYDKKALRKIAFLVVFFNPELSDLSVKT